MHVLHWRSWSPGAAPEGLSLSAFWPNTTEVEAVSGKVGPRLVAADVPGVGATVVAHRKSADEHVKVIGEAAGG